MVSSSRVLCTCISQGCSTRSYSDGGIIKPGQYVSSQTRKTHLLWEERNRSIVRSAAANNRFQLPPLRNQLSSPLVVADGVVESFTNLSINTNTRTSIRVETDEELRSANSSSPGNVEHLENLPIYYDSSKFHVNLINKNPAALFVNLKTSLFYVTQQISLAASGYLLKLDRQLIEIVASHGVDESSEPRGINYSERKTLDSFPKDPTTVIRHLAIDPDLNFLVCCPRCFAMYPTLTAPEQCIHNEFRRPPQHSNEFQDQFADDDQDAKSDAGRDSCHADDDDRHVCGADLFYEHRGKRRPIRQFAFHNFHSWLARLFSRSDIEDLLEETAKKSVSPFNDLVEISDIQDSRTWREFLGPDGHQFSAQAGNLIFAMFIDGINPYGNRQAGKHVSATFLIMVCLSLPFGIRYRPENIFLVGIAPGPKEPSLEQTNWILRPLVEQLKSLWSSGTYLSKTYQHPQGRLIRAALLPFFADLPALRRALGFAGHNARLMCSYCLIDKKDIKNFDRKSWPLRNIADHRHWANQSREASNAQAKKKILYDHGVRYSVLLELSYWNILEYHVVDAMHNLLLGILKWHCQRFWMMSDVQDEDQEPRAVSSRELHELLVESMNSGTPEPRPASPLLEESDQGMPFGDMLFGSNTDPSDADFVLGKDWEGEWIPHSSGKVILDKAALSSINRLLKSLHIPSWIGRAIPALGKASFGRLKADEWRNLFTIQLPLVLPAFWEDGDLANQSLLHNFAHLVSFVNLALKRKMSKERVEKYRHHLEEYMESSLRLFPDSRVAPNHHMAFHLSDCLEKYGPCRAWWSFSMERLMGTILKSTMNNSIGQMEITCLTNFYRIGNLRALLDRPDFPPALAPFIRQVKSLYNPIPYTPETTKKNRINLSKNIFKTLIPRINELFPLVNQTWICSDKWQKLRPVDIDKFAPLSSRVLKLPNFVSDEVVYSTVKANENNCIIALKPNTYGANFGIIEDVFQHSRVVPGKSTLTDTWLAIKPLIPIPPSVVQPYTQLEKYPIGVTIRKIDTSKSCVIHSQEILAHCAWTKYKPKTSAGETTHQGNVVVEEYIALVCLDR